jgi:type VI secretion system protein ImpK
MSPEFAKAVDPIFLHVLGLLDRIGKGENPVVQNERLRIRGWLDQAEARLGGRPDWQLAKYALVSWIDEVMLEAPWDGHEWWNENVLEVELFNTRLAHEEFYLKAREASGLPQRDALEVYYVCVVLGFRGLYRDPEIASTMSEALGMPGDLETWAKQTALAIRLGQGRPKLVESEEVGLGAPPLEGQTRLVWSSLFGVILAAILAAGFFYVVRAS